MMGVMDTDWPRLAKAVADRRLDLGMTQVELAQVSGLSLDRISAIERGRATSLRASTIRSLERGLGWESGSVRDIVAGGEPALLTERRPASPQELGDDFEARIERIRNNPAARKRLLDLLVAARLPEADEDDDRERHSDAG